jgi:hypothetical protein
MLSSGLRFQASKTWKLHAATRRLGWGEGRESPRALGRLHLSFSAFPSDGLLLAIAPGDDPPGQGRRMGKGVCQGFHRMVTDELRRHQPSGLHATDAATPVPGHRSDDALSDRI